MEKEKKASPIRKNTSLRLEQSVLKQLKIRAIEDDTSVQQLLEMLVIDYLKTVK
ncbi:MAG: CopG family transcriptional regulator [Piscirickettsiaceae bacterium]|nr:CopG family transcriptional regulator [Piscirickettsiaceae bacterium]